jgi:hypothetical protein
VLCLPHVRPAISVNCLRAVEDANDVTLTIMHYKSGNSGERPLFTEFVDRNDAMFAVGVSYIHCQILNPVAYLIFSRYISYNIFIRVTL